jgi:uncharacterized membrane protein YeaQ/YmgE (transglycosylase-associated protein family)
MGFISWIIVGLIAGWIASMVMKSEGGALRDIIMGIIGAFVGGFVMNFFGQSGVSGINMYSILVAALGAMIIIWIGRRFN